jgi:P27 family predicted phage terminase small subunit
MKGRRPSLQRRQKSQPFPRRPEWLTGRAAAEWDRIAVTLKTHGNITEVDQTALACYCQTYQRWREAEELCNSGLVIDGKANPAAKQADSLLKQLRGLLNELGFTPASRGRQEPPGDGESEEDRQLDALLMKKAS